MNHYLKYLETYMNNLETILDKYDKLEANLKYEKAAELLELISDDNVSNMYLKYPELFSTLSKMPADMAYSYVKYIDEAINIFIDEIKKQGLSREEFSAMTTDEIVEYLVKLYKKNNIDLYPIIKNLENNE